MTQRVSEAKRAEALAEVDNGAELKDVAKKYGVTPSGVSYWLKRRRKQSGSKAVVATPKNGKAVAVAVGPNPHSARDAVLFLRRAETELMGGIRAGNIQRLDPAHLFSLLALRQLLD